MRKEMKTRLRVISISMLLYPLGMVMCSTALIACQLALAPNYLPLGMPVYVALFVLYRLGFLLGLGFVVGLKAPAAKVKVAAASGLGFGIVLTGIEFAVGALLVKPLAGHNRAVDYSLADYGLSVFYWLAILTLQVAFAALGGWIASRRTVRSKAGNAL